MTIEELQEALLQEQEAHKLLKSQYDDLKAKNDELTTTNTKLTEYNNKLFMRVTEPIKQSEPTKELTAEEAEAKQIENIRKLMEERR